MRGAVRFSSLRSELLYSSIFGAELLGDELAARIPFSPAEAVSLQHYLFLQNVQGPSVCESGRGILWRRRFQSKEDRHVLRSRIARGQFDVSTFIQLLARAQARKAQLDGREVLRGGNFMRLGGEKQQLQFPEGQPDSPEAPRESDGYWADISRAFISLFHTLYGQGRGPSQAQCTTYCWVSLVSENLHLHHKSRASGCIAVPRQWKLCWSPHEQLDQQ
mmetsp:Transcript_17096/g.39767  ORF Transcript_17096/g.39767 Transcript_17096/m.39767 type:complete len:219 (+) Transcript_17096:700-1356(+)